MKIFNIILGIIVVVLSFWGIGISLLMVASNITLAHIWLLVILPPVYLVIPGMLFFSAIYFKRSDNIAMFYCSLIGMVIHIGNYLLQSVLT